MRVQLEGAMAMADGEALADNGHLRGVGERRLMWAVLIDAIHGYWNQRSLRTASRRRRAWVEDRAWFMSNDRSHAFSFTSVCDALGLEPRYVRQLVLRGNPFSTRPTRKLPI
jgi:hypothetical protein